MIKRHTRQKLFHFGAWVFSCGIAVLLLSSRYEFLFWIGIGMMISGGVAILIPLIHVLKTPMEELEKEKKKEGDWI